MHGGPGDGGLRRETGLPLAPDRRRWATWSTTPADSPASRASATTTCWERAASTSSRKALTWWRGFSSLPPWCVGWPPWPESCNSPTAPSRRACSSWGCAGSRTPRTPSGSSQCAGTGTPTGWWSPPQAGTATSLAYVPPAGVVAEFHSHGSARSFFSATDDRDEQGFRVYGVVGRLDTPEPDLSLRVGVYGHFAPLGWRQVFSGPNPGVRLTGEGPGSTTMPITLQGGN